MIRNIALGLQFLIILLVATCVHAQDEVASGRFVVSFSAERDQHSWLARALEQNVYNDLAGYGRIMPVPKIEKLEHACPQLKIKCVLDSYASHNVDAIMLGRVSASHIKFEVYDVRKQSLVKTGAITITRGSTLLQLRMGAFNAFKPFLAKGGILERRAFSKKNISPTLALLIDSEEVKSDDKRNILLVSVAIFTCLPYLLSFFGAGRKNKIRSRLTWQWFWPFICLVFSLLAISYYSTFPEYSEYYFSLSQTLKQYRWACVAVSGILWGYFLVLNLSIIHPHFQGLERIDQQTLLPLLESYLLTFTVKLLVLLGFYAAGFFGIQLIAEVLSIPRVYVPLFVLPLAGLYLLYWVGLLLEVMAMQLDARLSRRHDDFVEVWDAKIRKYFISYAKRNGLTLDEKLFSRVIFLVGLNSGVVCYGGFFSRPRIVVDYDLLLFALGDNNPAIQEYNRPSDRTSTLSLFMPHIFPRLLGKKKRISRKKHLNLIAQFESSLECDLNRHSSGLKIGQDKIMKGIIIPRLEGKDDLPSLMSDNLEDMSIVEELMQEDTTKSTPYDEDAEIDDSSERDKDFLFGMLLHKFGELVRFDHLFLTAYMYFFKNRSAKNLPYRFPLSDYFSRVADTFVVMNHGLNHLLQYLYYRATFRSDFLTTKGRPEKLLDSQHKILSSVATLKKEMEEQVDAESNSNERRDGRSSDSESLASEISKDDKKSLKSQLDQKHKERRKVVDRFERIVWLSNFCKESIESDKNIRVRKPIVWLFSLSLLVFFTTLFLQSYRYHPVYESKIAEEKREIVEMIREAQEQQRKNP